MKPRFTKSVATALISSLLMSQASTALAQSPREPVYEPGFQGDVPEKLCRVFLHQRKLYPRNAETARKVRSGELESFELRFHREAMVSNSPGLFLEVLHHRPGKKSVALGGQDYEITKKDGSKETRKGVGYDDFGTTNLALGVDIDSLWGHLLFGDTLGGKSSIASRHGGKTGLYLREGATALLTAGSLYAAVAVVNGYTKGVQGSEFRDLDMTGPDPDAVRKNAVESSARAKALRQEARMASQVADSAKAAAQEAANKAFEAEAKLAKHAAKEAEIVASEATEEAKAAALETLKKNKIAASKAAERAKVAASEAAEKAIMAADSAQDLARRAKGVSEAAAKTAAFSKALDEKITQAAHVADKVKPSRLKRMRSAIVHHVKGVAKNTNTIIGGLAHNIKDIHAARGGGAAFAKAMLIMAEVGLLYGEWRALNRLADQIVWGKEAAEMDFLLNTISEAYEYCDSGDAWDTQFSDLEAAEKRLQQDLADRPEDEEAKKEASTEIAKNEKLKELESKPSRDKRPEQVAASLQDVQPIVPAMDFAESAFKRYFTKYFEAYSVEMMPRLHKRTTE